MVYFIIFVDFQGMLDEQQVKIFISKIFDNDKTIC